MLYRGFPWPIISLRFIRLSSFALGASSASVIARSLGKGDVKATNRDIWDAIIITLALSIVLGSTLHFFGGAILNLLGTEQSVTQAGSLYLAIVGGGVIFLALMTTFGNILRAKGTSLVFPWSSVFLTNLLNALLSSLAIFVGHWGIIGVASGYGFSRLVGTVILWTAMKLDVKQFEVTKPFNKELLGIVLPAAGERLMMRAGDVVIVAIIVTFGTAVVGGNAIGENLIQFNYMPGMGWLQLRLSWLPIVWGEGDTAQMKRIIRESYWISTFLMVLVSGSILLFGQGLSSFFTDNKVAIAASQVVILYSFLGKSCNFGDFSLHSSGLARSWEGQDTFYATTIGMWLIRIFSGYFLGVSLRMGLAGVWIATVVDNIWRAIFLYVMYRHYLSKETV